MKTIITACALLMFLAPATGGAQDFFIYPAKGQSQDQQEKDKYSCYQWAKGQTGFDPMEAPRATAPPPAQEAPKGGLFKGATRGALTGLAVGAIAGDAGKGAAIGAAGGGLVGGARRSDQKRSEAQKQDQWAQDQSQQYAQKRNSYNRAYTGCLEGRGYTVK
ncbi:MAG: glycine zipper domain-containing protein [Thermodesulfobacteriota bacterium]|nr:glycine zipper domain-containing protein [Thermodesulfobacteriota bacterium]